MEEDRGEGSLSVESTQPTSDPVPGTSASCDKVNVNATKLSEDVDSDNLSLEGVALADSIIRRPRSGSKKRNYRQTSQMETTSSGDEEPKSTSSRLDEESTDVNLDKPTATECVKGQNDETSSPGPSSSVNCAENDKIHTDSKPGSVGVEEDDHMSTSSNLQALEHSPSPPLGLIPSEDSSSSSSDHSDFSPRLAYYNPEPDGAEIEDSSSSSSSSLEFMEDELDDDDDTSSESSDSLDDLVDRPPIGSKTNATSDQPVPEGPRNKSKNAKSKSLPKVLTKPKAKCDWSGPKAIFQREMGYRTRIQAQGAEIFRSKFYGSLFSVERLELAKKLEGHDGCVNCLNFNYAGTKLASGSDDLEIKIWDYGVGKLLTSFHSKHRSNVFQAKFMPLIGLDNIIVSCARDSQVRLTELSNSGSPAADRKLAQHRGPVHKLAINPETPHIVLSCGEDGVVMNCDIREDKSQKILSLVENGRKVSLYSIHSNPMVSTEFCVAGRDEYVRLFDTRKLSRSTVSSANGDGGGTENNNSIALKRFCPHRMQGHSSKPHITAAVYNYNGEEIIASYNDENIYLFETCHSDLADSVHCYEGHLNSVTVKGVNFFGDKSQFIISGSDDSHIFIWDRQSESIVNFFRGDEKGVVNCLEPHPSAPILATSGLDDDIKIWIPSSETPPKMGELASTVKKNIKKRDQEIASRPNELDGQIMWQLINHFQSERRRNRRAAGEGNSDSSSDDDDDDDADADTTSRGIECVIA